MDQHTVNLLKEGKVGVMPTDTLYGLVGKALNKQAVEKIYQIKGRSENKPFIVLISSLGDLNLFGIHLDDKTYNFLQQIWPNPISVVLPCLSESFFYLHRGTHTLAFRLPKDNQLIKLLKQAGPLVAPSANPEGEPSAKTVEEAKNYFGDQVDFYVDGGALSSEPSTLIKIDNHHIITLRQGVFKNYPSVINE